MAKPPQTPPSSDIDGVHEDRVDRRSVKSIDPKAPAQMETNDRETVGRPERGNAVAMKRGATGANSSPPEQEK